MSDWYELGGQAIGAIASLFGADSASRNVRKTNEMNYKIAQETNANQLQIARENNQMQLDAMRENNAFNKQSAIDMFNLEADYNNPSATKARLLAAGINPATMYGQGSSIGGSVDASTPSASSSGISPSMPSFSVPHMETPPSVINTMFGNIESVSRAVSNLARSSLDRATKESTLAKLQPEIDKILADTKNTEVKTKHEELMLRLDNIFAMGDRSRRAKKENQEIKVLCSQYFLNSSKAFEADANADLRKIESYLADTRNQMLKEQAPIILQNLKEEGDLLREKQRTEQTQQGLNTANASKANAEARTENAMRQFNVDLADYRSQLAKMDVEARSNSFQEEKDAILKEMQNRGLISDAQRKEFEEMAEIARKKNTMFYYDWWFDKVERVNNGANQWAPWAVSRTQSQSTTRNYYDNSGRPRTETTTTNSRQGYIWR